MSSPKTPQRSWARSIMTLSKQLKLKQTYPTENLLERFSVKVDKRIAQ